MESEYWSCESELEEAYWTALHMADDEDEQDQVQWREVSSMERSKAHWSELLDDEDDLAQLVALGAKNLEVFRGLQDQQSGGFFQVLGDEWELGGKINEGGQAEIFEVERSLHDGTKDKWVLKTFKRGYSLQDLVKMLPKGMLTNLNPSGHYSNGHSCSMYALVMLQDGRFAILMRRYWGDLRHLIDLRMRRSINQDMSFRNVSMVVPIMLDIALGIRALHKDGIVHGDLKASNVLIWPLEEDYDPIYSRNFICHVADYETSVGVTGTGFWRAPEILLAIKNRNFSQHPSPFTEKSDAYAFAMTSYEILTGRIPFEGHRPNDFDLVLQGTRPKIPISIDLWVKELLEVCWHEDPLQRPSFEKIVNILQARLRDNRERDILAPRPLLWEEVNDPIVRRDKDSSMEISEKVLIQMLVVVLDCCKQEFKKLKSIDQVDMFKNQCKHLVASLSSDIGNMFQRFQLVWEILKESTFTNANEERLELTYWFKCVAFGIHSLVDLTRNFQMVEEMLLECGAEDWWKVALYYSTTPPHPQVPRWSVFGLALQQCQWSMDIAHLAILEMIRLVIGLSDLLSNNPEFHWCEERQRMVLQSRQEFSGSLQAAITLEAQDTVELLRKLERFLDEVPSRSSEQKSYQNHSRLASFLLTKLTGPTPDAKYSPYSFQIDPPINLVSRSPITVVWCDKILCHVKKVKGRGYQFRKTMEMDAAPLATVQHPNVVHFIGYTVQTSGHEIGWTNIITKFVYPSKETHLRDEATGMLVMELMEGDLRNLMDQRCPNPGPNSRPFSLIVALDIMLKIAEAMRFVHQHKILHRDLKTTNVLFRSTSSGAIPSYPTLNLDHIRELGLLHLLTPERFYTIKLADFGLAKYSPTESKHIVNANIGTPRYMAPEMFFNPEAAVPSEYNWSCDVYSFAMTCSAILTGNEPFHFIEKSTTRKVMASVVDKTAEVQIRPDLGLGDALPSLKYLIERCWDKDPLERPPFSEICKELWNCKVRATTSCLRRRVA